MNAGYVIAKKDQSGRMGRPIGNEDGAIMIFEDFQKTKEVRDEMQAEYGELNIFKANLVFVGEVVE